jgi:hypothetical protein
MYSSQAKSPKRILNIYYIGTKFHTIKLEKENAMKIVRIRANQRQKMTLEEFADCNGLVMEVRERESSGLEGTFPRYFACFQDCEIKEECVLISFHGDGNTEKEAIRNYARRISGMILVRNAHRADRVELDVPILV